jgi:hypothetical protein
MFFAGAGPARPREVCMRWVKDLRNLNDLRSWPGTDGFSIDLGAGCSTGSLSNPGKQVAADGCFVFLVAPSSN